MMSPLEAIGVLFALAYLLLAIRENPLCWFAAIVSSLCYVYIFFEATLYTESLLQFFFIGMAFQGLKRWGTGKEEARGVHIRRLPLYSHIAGIALCAITSALLSTLIQSLTAAPLALVDSAITVFSIYTTWLVTEKILENWLYWIMIDLVAVWVYIVKDLHFTAALFALYVILAAVGYFQWLRMLGDKNATQPTGENA